MTMLKASMLLKYKRASIPLLFMTIFLLSACNESEKRTVEPALMGSEETSSKTDDDTLVQKNVSGDVRVIFATQKPVEGLLYDAIATTGVLEVDKNGCFRINGRADGDGSTIIWPSGFDMRVENGKVTITDDQGKPVARVGDTIRGGGSEILSLHAYRQTISREVRRELPDLCPGSYLDVSPGITVLREGS